MKTIFKNIFLKVIVGVRLLMWRVPTAKFQIITPLNEAFFTKDNIKCVVIGNGPSLKNDIGSILNMRSVDFFCVNHMAETEWFTKLKPKHYALFDPYFWSDEAHDSLKAKRNCLYKTLTEAVTWEMYIYIPRNADLTFLESEIKNKNIKLKQLETVAISAVQYDGLAKILLKGKYGPPACNVIIYAMYLAIMANYKEIELFGADLSFTEDVVVNQKNNQVCIEYRHFYGESTLEPLYANPRKVKPITMESLYRTTYLTFFAHNLLSKMAKLRNIKVVNKSSYSIIDAYERN